MNRADTLEALRCDVAAVLNETGSAEAAAGRLLAQLSAGTAVENANTLRDVLAASQVALTRDIYAAKGA